MKPTRYWLQGIGSFSEAILAKYLAYFWRSMDYGSTTITEKTVRATSAASRDEVEKSRSSKRLESSVNTMAPTVAKVHLRVHAKKVAKKSGSLKWSLDGLPSVLGSAGELSSSSGTQVCCESVELKASIPKARPKFGV